MKITRRQLRRLIKESFSGYASERPNNPMERAYAKRETEAALDLRKIFNVVVGGIDMDDRPDFVDAYIESAEYEHSPGKFRDLTQSELDYLNSEEPNWVYQQMWDQVH
jgi:hypothetical protein